MISNWYMNHSRFSFKTPGFVVAEQWRGDTRVGGGVTTSFGRAEPTPVCAVAGGDFIFMGAKLLPQASGLLGCGASHWVAMCHAGSQQCGELLSSPGKAENPSQEKEVV